MIKVNFVYGLILYLSSNNPIVKKKVIKNKRDIISLLKNEDFSKIKKISKKNNCKKISTQKFKKNKIPPKTGTECLCIFNLPSGLSYILINFAILVKLENKMRLNIIKVKLIINYKIIVYMNIDKYQYNKSLL